jgi:hypothetical protein
MSGNLREVMDAARKAKAEPEPEQRGVIDVEFEEVTGPPKQPRAKKTAQPAPNEVRPAGGRRPQKMGKSRNPDFKRLVILVRKDTENAALRLLMDEPEKMDLSDLVEKLLSSYVHKHSST